MCLSELKWILTCLSSCCADNVRDDPRWKAAFSRTSSHSTSQTSQKHTELNVGQWGPTCLLSDQKLSVMGQRRCAERHGSASFPARRELGALRPLASGSARLPVPSLRLCFGGRRRVIAFHLGSLLAVLDNDSQSSRWRLLELRATSRAAPATPCPSRRGRHHGEGEAPGKRERQAPGPGWKLEALSGRTGGGHETNTCGNSFLL